MTRYMIVAPSGGFGNYVRWLMLLDRQFSDLKLKRKDAYLIIAGPDWPSYDDYLLGDFNNISSDIIDEIKIKTEIKFDTLDKKIKFIKENVFPPERTHDNWLNYEWKYRYIIDDAILFEHAYIKSNLKTLILTVDPILAYECYVKFNPSLNNLTKNEFISGTARLNQIHTAYAKSNKNIEILDSTTLYTPILNRAWYQELISKFDLDDNYGSANDIHKSWYNQHTCDK